MAVHNLGVDRERDFDVLRRILLHDVQRPSGGVPSAHGELGSSVEQLQRTVVVLLPVQLVPLVLHKELVLHVPAFVHRDRSLPHVTIAPLKVHAVVYIPLAQLIGVPHHAYLVAVVGLHLDAEVNLHFAGVDLAGVLLVILLVVAGAGYDGANRSSGGGRGGQTQLPGAGELRVLGRVCGVGPDGRGERARRGHAQKVEGK